MVAAAIHLIREHYGGPWLRDGQDASGGAIPADAGYLRNYVVRKGLELLFDGIAGHSKQPWNWYWTE